MLNAPPQLSALAARTAFGTQSLNTLQLPPLFVVATFRDPISRTDRPLPPHRWTLQPVASGPAAITGVDSDPDGISHIQTGAQVHAAPSEWELTWVPVGTSLGPNREVWVDLDNDSWVAAADVQPIEKRPLVRLVTFSSREKAARGGLLDPPTVRFGADGIFGAHDFVPLLLAHGDHGHPLRMRVDHRLFRTFIRFRFYDTLGGQSRSVPSGLVLEAVDRAGSIVGGGTAIEPEGTYYVLHTRARADSHDLHYRFETPDPFTLVDNAAFNAEEPAPENAIAVAPALPNRKRARYVLPRRFHTRGWEARVGTRRREAWPDGPPADPAVRDVRNRTTRQRTPLTFHLDDTLLVDRQRRPLALTNDTEHTVFDQLLAIRSPNGAEPHISAPHLPRNYLRAEVSIIPRGSRVEELARAVDFNGTLYDLRDERIGGAMGSTTALGARMAVAHDHPVADFTNGAPLLPNDGTFELHLFDTLIDDFIYEAGATHMTRLHHLMVYVSAFVIDTSGLIRPLLDAAARRWDGLHPAHDPNNDGQGQRLHAIVPALGVTTGSPLVLVRHFFGHRQAFVPRRPRIRFHETLPARSHFNPNTRTIEIERSSLTSAQYLAHEFGHVVDLPDEYPELIPGTDLFALTQNPSGNTRTRAFVRDVDAYMQGSIEPRLRFRWHDVHALNNVGSFQAALGNEVFVAETRQGPGAPLSYRLPAVPATVLPAEEHRHPWFSLGQRALTPGAATAFLFRLGDDEGAAGGLFGGDVLRQSSGGPRFHADGLLVVRINVLMTGLAVEDRPAPATALMLLVTEGWHVRDHVFRPFFIVSNDDSAVLKRVAVEFQPYFSLTTAAAAVDLRIRLIAADATVPNPLLQPRNLRPNPLPLRASDMSYAVYRHALGVATVDGNGNLRADVLRPSDIAASPLIAVLKDILGEADSVVRTVAQVHAGGVVS